MTRKKHRSSEPGGAPSPLGTSDQGAHQERLQASTVTEASGKHRLPGRRDKAKAVPGKSREYAHKVSAPLSPTLQTTSGRVSNAQTPRRKPKANLAPSGGKASSSQPEEQRHTAAARPDQSLPVTSPHHPATLPTAKRSSPCLEPSVPALPEATHAPHALLLSARETSWVSAGRRGLSETSNLSCGRSTGLSTHGPCTKDNALTARERALASIGCLLPLFLFMVVVTFIVLTFKTEKWHRKDEQYCATLDCQLHARLLTAHLNTSMDPCEDFSAYVCSGWSPTGDYREHIKTPVDSMAFYRIAGFDTILVEGTRKIPAGMKALQMHKSCMNDQDHGGLHLRQFQALMREMGLSWPEAPDEVNALDVLIALSYKWQVHLWIEVRVLALPESRKWRLAINHASALPVIINHYNNVKDIATYTPYWMGYFADLNPNTTAFMNGSDVAAAIMESREMESAILNILEPFTMARRQSPTVFSLGNIGNYSKPITFTTWMNALHKNVALSPPLDANHDVALNHENFLDTIGSLFHNFSEQKIISQCAWTFVQQYAPIAEPRMLLRRFGDRYKVKAYRPIFCGFHVEATYKVLLLSLDIAARIKDTDKVIIETGFQTLVSAAVKKIESSLWMDADSKKNAKDKITSVKMQAWVSDLLMKNEELEEIYKDYPSAEGSFAAYWIHTRQAIRYKSEKVRHINDSQTYWDALGLPLNFVASYAIYDYVTGTLALPIYQLDRPLYYSEGTNSMFFGGLGFLLALNFIKALDEVGVRWLPNGTNVDSILSKEARKAFENMGSCLEPDGAEGPFPEIPALEMAYAALEVTDKTSNGSLDVQRGLPSLNAFFMTICYMACALPGFKSAFTADCNKIARNSAVFATAFNCTSGSKMNPEKKCHLFS